MMNGVWNQCDHVLKLKLYDLKTEVDTSNYSNQFYKVSMKFDMLEVIGEEDFISFKQRQTQNIQQITYPKTSEAYFLDIQGIKLAFISKDEFNDLNLIELKNITQETSLLDNAYDELIDKIVIKNQNCIQESRFSLGTPFIEVTRADFNLVIPIYHQKDKIDLNTVNDDALKLELVQKKISMEDKIKEKVEEALQRKRQRIQDLKQNILNRKNENEQKIMMAYERIQKVKSQRRSRENSLDGSKSKIEII